MTKSEELKDDNFAARNDSRSTIPNNSTRDGN